MNINNVKTGLDVRRSSSPPSVLTDDVFTDNLLTDDVLTEVFVCVFLSVVAVKPPTSGGGYQATLQSCLRMDVECT